jgi:toxin ParE1/3/4
VPVWKAAAIADRKGVTHCITPYIAQDKPRAAVEMGDLLVHSAEKLDAHPLLGRAGRVPGTRELVVHPNYLLIYRVVGGVPEVLRIKHAAQQWP